MAPWTGRRRRADFLRRREPWAFADARAPSATRDRGGDADSFVADVTDEAAVVAAVNAALARYGKIDVFVHGAAISAARRPLRYGGRRMAAPARRDLDRCVLVCQTRRRVDGSSATSAVRSSTSARPKATKGTSVTSPTAPRNPACSTSRARSRWNSRRTVSGPTRSRRPVPMQPKVWRARKRGACRGRARRARFAANPSSQLRRGRRTARPAAETVGLRARRGIPGIRRVDDGHRHRPPHGRRRNRRATGVEPA